MLNRSLRPFVLILTIGIFAAHRAAQGADTQNACVRTVAESLQKSLATPDRQTIPAPTQSLRGGWIVTSDSLQAALKHPEQIQPPIPPQFLSFLDDTYGINTYAGFMGPAGPLSPTIGVVGKNPFLNPTPWIDAYGWHSFDQFLRKDDGPDSALSPLLRWGPDGTLGTDFLDSNPFLIQFRKGGLFAMGGREGLGSPRGLLGSDGPNGTHGYKMLPNGQYVDDQGKRVFNHSVGQGSDKKKFELVELYDAKDLKNHPRTHLLQDRAFAVDGNLARGEADTFPIIAKGGDHLVLSVTPGSMSDRFQLELLTEDGKVVAKVNPGRSVPFIEMYVPHNTQFKVRVTQGGTSFWNVNPFFPQMFETGIYRLHVNSLPAIDGGTPKVAGPQIGFFE